MIADAEQLAKEGKPHYIEIQGAQYEGATVWFQHDGGERRRLGLKPERHEGDTGRPHREGALDHEGAGFFAGGRPVAARADGGPEPARHGERQAAFELNYPYVYPSMKADVPKLFKVFKWALYPEVTPGVPAKVTIGGTDLAVSHFSQHKALAFQAALCLRDKQNQITAANVGGLPPTITSLYNNPALFADYPFHADILHALENASVRPKTPVYQVVSIDISHLISPASGIKPDQHGEDDGQSTQRRPAIKGLVLERRISERRSTRRRGADERRSTVGTLAASDSTEADAGRRRKPRLSEGARAERKLGWLLCAPRSS